METLIAIGSNLGNRLDNVATSIYYLKDIGVVTPSPLLMETADETNIGPNYLNTAILLRVTNKNINPKQLLEYLLTLEIKLGRDRLKKRNSPRTIDLDLIAINGIHKAIWHWPTPQHLILLGPMLCLELPHPRAYCRSFVMEPIKALKPSFFINS